MRRVAVGIVITALTGGAIVADDWVEKRWTKALPNASVQEIISMLNLGATPDFHTRLDDVRIFINDNSEHKIDEEFKTNQGNSAAFATGSGSLQLSWLAFEPPRTRIPRQ